MKRLSIDPAQAEQALRQGLADQALRQGLADQALRQGLALTLQDLALGRAELQDAAARFNTLGDPRGELLAAATLTLVIGIADDDYDGFEAAIATVMAQRALVDTIADPADKLLTQAGALVAGTYIALDAPGLAAQAATLAQALARTDIPASVRCCAGLAALNYHRIGMDLPSVMWLELAMRPLLADASVNARLVGEAFHLFVQSLYECEAPPQAAQLRQRWLASRDTASAHAAPQPAIELKFLLLDAQMALGLAGAAHAEVGRQALALAEPLLNPRAPRTAGWWHFLNSRLNLMQGQHRSALTHARLALRLMTESRAPERWMGLIVMQEGQVQMAVGAYAQALPFFERAGREASGSQAGFCHCLAHLAQALQHLQQQEEGDAPAELSEGLNHLASGLKLARELLWLNFFRPSPHVAAAICAAALAHGIEAPFVREVIQLRGLPVARPDLVEWPWPIRVRSLGALRIELNNQALNFKGKVAKKPLELLLFVVASSGSDVSVATVAFALWRELDGDKARAALNVALHRLRKLLGSDDAVLLAHGRLSLNAQTVWVDCLAFEQLADSAGLPTLPLLTAPLRAAAQRAVALYTGPFLGDSEDEAWQMVYRSRLASKFKRMVTLLARDAITRGENATARAVVDRGLECDPLADDLVQMRAQISTQVELGG